MSGAYWYPPEVPEWHKKKLREQGWRPCPDDEVCDECGRPTQEGGEMCCGYYMSEKKLLGRYEEDGSLYYPYPTEKELYERITELEARLDEQE